MSKRFSIGYPDIIKDEKIDKSNRVTMVYHEFKNRRERRVGVFEVIKDADTVKVGDKILFNGAVDVDSGVPILLTIRKLSNHFGKKRFHPENMRSTWEIDCEYFQILKKIS